MDDITPPTSIREVFELLFKGMATALMLVATLFLIHIWNTPHPSHPIELPHPDNTLPVPPATVTPPVDPNAPHPDNTLPIPQPPAPVVLPPDTGLKIWNPIVIKDFRVGDEPIYLLDSGTDKIVAYHAVK